MMQPRTSHIEAFSRFLAPESRQAQSFFLLNPDGEHQYLFKPTSRAVRIAASLISGEGLKRTLGSYLLRACSYTPSVVSLIPLISRVSVDVPTNQSFDVAVISNRTRIIDLNQDRVYTIPTDQPYGVVKEIRARNDLPAEINTPQIYETDLNYPFFSEEFIRGRRPRSPIKEWPVMQTALEQLHHIHETPVKTIPVVDVRTDIEQLLSERGLLETNPFGDALDLLDSLELPQALYVTKIHGDFHARNVLLDGEEVYILDWEMYRFDYSFRDFFKPFVVSHYDTRDPSCIRGMISGKGTGGDIYANYIHRFGASICPDPKPYPGLPLLYLLLELARKSEGELWESYRELLESLVTQRSLTRS